MNERPFPRRVTGFWALALCLALTAAPVRGAESPRAADLYLWLDARGDAQAALSLDFEPPDSPELERGLHRLLGARAEDVGLNEEGGGWVLRARGRGMLRRRGLVVAGVLDAGPLREPLRRLGVRAFTVSVSHPEAGFTRCAEATRVPQIKPGDVTYLTAFPTALAVTLLRLEYGYRAGDLLRICGPLALFLLLPIGATLALRRRALRAAGEEPAAVWFRYART
jgi:hypothetical protein